MDKPITVAYRITKEKKGNTLRMVWCDTQFLFTPKPKLTFDEYLSLLKSNPDVISTLVIE